MSLIPQQEKPKFITFGHKRHGKDFACEYLREKYNISFTSSSRVACDLFMFDLMKKQHHYASADECFDDRDNHREFWYNKICEFNTPDKARLGKIIFKDHSNYCGIRDKLEFDKLEKCGAFDISIWIDASKRLPPEESNSMKLSIRDAHIIVDNNGSKEQLFKNLDDLYLNVLSKSRGELLEKYSRLESGSMWFG